MYELDIIENCIARFNDLKLVNVVKTIDNAPGMILTELWDNKYFWDAEIDVEFAGRHQLFGVQCKRNLTTTTVRHATTVFEDLFKDLETAHAKRTKPLIFADYINGNVAERLRDVGINFVDAVGNMFLTYPKGLYINIQGIRRQVDDEKQKMNLFQPAGLKIITCLLLDPTLLNDNQRNIGHKAGVALGTVAGVFKELKTMGYVQQTGLNQLALIKRKDLFDKWVEGYVDRLRPKQVIGKYAAYANDINDIIRNARNALDRNKIKWAAVGEYAENQLIEYYETGKLTIFAERFPDEIVRQCEWLPAKDGNITVLKGFGECVYRGFEKNGVTLAGAPLIYAELIADGNDRARDAAARIYDRYIKELIDND